MKTKFKFNKKIAKCFKQEALNNIPDYVKVISLTKDIIKELFPDKLNLTIIDIGSALGYTIDQLYKSGFYNVFGLEKSEEMRKRSKHQDRVFLGDSLNTNHIYDVIIANWTLHFIKDRYEFIKSIYDALSFGGLFILTDKMDSDQTTKQHYVDFKLERGMSNKQILKKSRRLEGVLETKPLSWYLETLKSIGFKDIQIVNSRLMFKTLICKK